MKGRTILVLLAAAAASVQVVRSAAVEYGLGAMPQVAARFWPGHPQVAMKQGLADIGLAAVKGETVDPGMIDRVIGAASRAPLSPEPFLVRGVEQQLAGQNAAAGAAFMTAKARDPRSLAARFFLANHWFMVGDIDRALDEATGLSRLVPGSQPGMAPVLAQFARTKGGADRLKAALANKPDIRAALLANLAANPANADLILFLADGRETSSDWRRNLINSLVAAGEYRKAYALWSPAGGQAKGHPLLFDPEFKATASATPPFGWSLTSDGNGIAVVEGGGLHVIYYGRQNMVLATQTLLLAPGRYRLATRMAGGGAKPGVLAWTMTCLGSNTPFLTASLGRVAAGSAPIAVPLGCTAQRLDLVGVAPEFPETADVTILGLDLAKDGG